MSDLVQRIGLRTVLSLGGVCAVGLTAWLIYYFNDDDEDDEFKVHKTSRTVIAKVEVSEDMVSVLIGRSGSNIKQIEKQTNARINVSDKKDSSSKLRIVTIRGSSEAVTKAETLIYSQINNQPAIETEEMFIPTRAVARVIGKVGTTIKDIIKKSNAKITVESNNTHERTKITIKGTVEQIAVAMELINKKVEEYNDVKQKMSEGLSKRSPYRTAKNQNQYGLESQTNSEVQVERLVSTSSDGSLTVFMSAVATPEKFWVQLMNDRAVELDQLVDAMTDYYNNENNRESHKATEVKQGQIVAALLDIDQKWYRAEVSNIVTKENQTFVDLYFVDYGDSIDVAQSQVYELKSSFLALRFQAVECSLSNVKPVGDIWTPEANQYFEDLTHLAQWKPLLARVESYKEGISNKRSGSPIPCINLFDTTGGQDVNVREELIKKGFAVSTKTSPDNTITSNGSNSSDSDTLVEDPPKPSSNESNTRTLNSETSMNGESESSSTPPKSLGQSVTTTTSSMRPSSASVSSTLSNQSSKKREGSDKKKKKF